jgi:CheY-like chemotaxis protein
MALRRVSSFNLTRTVVDKEQQRILYVEDDDATWQVTERYLRERYTIERARNSDEALQMLREKPFNLILLDIELAGSALDGIALCRVLRGKPDPRHARYSQPPGMDGVPIVFVTAYTARYPKEELLAMGADEAVTKPVDYTRLLLVSSRLLLSGVGGPSRRAQGV